MVSSSHRLPYSELACEVPPGSASSAECGYKRRTSRLPSYGVAASSVSSMSSAEATLLPSTFTGVPGEAGQYRHGALNQTLAQVSNGACSYTAQLSLAQRAQLCGHCTSLHCTAS